MNHTQTIFKLGCIHNPKKISMEGILNNSKFQILVCINCSKDPDLQNFKEKVISN